MNSTATRMESRSVIDDVRGEFSCVEDGRRADARSPWPGTGSSRSGISPPRRRGKSFPIQTASATLGGLMNLTATRMESRSVIDDVRGEFSCVEDGRRADARSPWPGTGSSRSGISPPRRRGKSFPIQTASATLGGLMNLTATRMESRSVIDDVRGEFSCVEDGRRADARSPWPGTGSSRSGISPPRRRGKSFPIQTASASLGELSWIPFVHGVGTEVLAARLPRCVPPFIVLPLIEATTKPANQLRIYTTTWITVFNYDSS